MSKLQINALFELPADQFPLDEVVSIKYVVGYFVGSSFRVLCRLDELKAATDIASSYKIATLRDTFVFRVKVNIQLM